MLSWIPWYYYFWWTLESLTEKLGIWGCWREVLQEIHVSHYNKFQWSFVVIWCLNSHITKTWLLKNWSFIWYTISLTKSNKCHIISISNIFFYMRCFKNAEKNKKERKKKADHISWHDRQKAAVATDMTDKKRLSLCFAKKTAFLLRMLS